MDDTVSDSTNDAVLIEDGAEVIATNSSPSHLQDAGIDNSNLLGFRSPPYNTMSGYGETTTTTPPGHRVSLREYEEQMTSLKKENFNLKLRIFFLEEKTPSLTQTSEGGESLFKQNVDLKVEIETLRKELEEKQELVCQAAKAMELMEDEQKKHEMLAATKIEELQKKINYLEMEIEVFDSKAQPQGGNRSNVQANLETQVTVDDLNRKIECLEELVNTKDIELTELRENVQKISRHNDDLKKRMLESENENEEISKNIKCWSQNELDYKLKIHELSYHNEELKRDLIDERKLLKMTQQDVRGLNLLIDKLNLEIELLRKELHEKQVLIQQAADLMKNDLQRIEEKDVNIEQLRVEALLKTQIADLKQELADKVCLLEDAETKVEEKKNALDGACKLMKAYNTKIKDLETEIEVYKQTKDTTKSIDVIRSDMEKEILNSKIKINHLSAEISQWKHKYKKTAECLQTVVNKELWQKNREIERLNKLLFKESAVATTAVLSSENQIQLNGSYTEEQCLEAITQKEILQSRVNELIEQLAKSQASPTTENNLRLELREANARTEQAIDFQKQCLNVCEILKEHLEELAEFLSSILESKDYKINSEWRLSIKNAVDRSLDVSKSLNKSLSLMESSFFDNLNTSELLDSYPLAGSTARPSLLDTSHHRNAIEGLRANIASLKIETQKRRQRRDRESKDRRSFLMVEAVNNSESETWSEPDRNVSLARIGIDVDQSMSSAARKKDTSTESESGAAGKRSSVERKRLSIARLEEVILEKDNKLLQMECALMQCENDLKRERLRIAEKMEKIDKQMCDYESEVVAKNETIIQLKADLEDKLNMLKDFELTKVNLRVAEAKIEMSKTNAEDVKARHRKEVDHLRTELIKVESERTELVEKLEKQLRQREKDIKDNFVPRNDFERMEMELNERNQNLRSDCDSWKLKYDQLESQFKMVDAHARKLRKELDGATIQASQLALERTRALTEKSSIENKSRQLEIEILKLSPRKSTGASLNNSGNRNIGGGGGGSSSSENERHTNSSPDLGIESDVPRPTRSVELAQIDHQMLRTLEIQPKVDPSSSTDNETVEIEIKLPHDCRQIELEYQELRKKYRHLNVSYMNMFAKLKESNLQKEQVHRNIKKQILKTNNVLQVVRQNMENQFISGGGVPSSGDIALQGNIALPSDPNKLENKEN